MTLLRSAPPDALTDALIVGRLPEEAITAIKQMELTIEQVEEWQRSKTSARLVAMKRELIVEVQAHISMKKALANLSGISGFILMVANLVFRYLPKIQKMLGGRFGT